MNRSYKYRLYPSEQDKEDLEKHLDLCRQVYNHVLEKLNEADETPSRYELQKQLPELKKEWTELQSVHSKVLQMVLKQLYDNLKSLSEQKKKGYKVGKLRYKAENAGTEVVLVDPKDTSKECSQCGVKTDKNLWQREHSCPSCGYTTDRDYNAAQNILGKGLAEDTPAETATSTEDKEQKPVFCDVSASCVIETGSPFHLEAQSA